MNTARTGGCLCGAVRFEIAPFDPVFGTCHCKMCQRWAGSALLALTVPAATLAVSGQGFVATYSSSDWADRSFCRQCGSSLWYRTQDTGTHHLPIGLLDDTSGLTMASEIYHDLKPDCFDLSQSTRRYTTAETLALFAQQEDLE